MPGIGHANDLADLRNELAERKKLEQQIIADRVRELTGEDETQW